jgi:Periplasmic component of the Tol biopolymer transport system
MDKKSICEIKAITFEPKHHLFGFHDLCAWNSNNDRLVVLEVDDILTPPNPDIVYKLGYIDNENRFIQFGTTRAFNYPQSARQQWIDNTNHVIVNDIRDKRVISKIYDTDSCSEVDILNESAHVVTADGWAFGLDYARLFRLGAYGYAGVEDRTVGMDAPGNSGIIKHNIYTKEKNLLLSVESVANFQMDSKLGRHHYITHLVLSPDQKRIAFLHRFILGDGGVSSRLCTIGINGENLRCLSSGFLSHFDWSDNEHIMIWGRIGSGVEKLRQHPVYSLIPPKVLQIAKEILKKTLRKSSGSNFHWMNILDADISIIDYIAEGIITEDGHPMFCPTNRDWFICDNYPDKTGVRTLFLFNIKTNTKMELGKFNMLDEKPDLQRSKELLRGTEDEIMNIVGLENFAFTRSGLHCDLHPRWSPDGTKIAFDSIHDGTRQIYSCNVKSIVQ